MAVSILCVIGGIASAGDQPTGADTQTVSASGAENEHETADKAAADKAAAEKAAADKAAAEKAAADKAAAEKAAADKAAADQAAAKKAAAEKAAKEKAAEEKAAEEKAAKAAANRRVAMPDLVGLKLNIAASAWQNRGLTNVTVCRTPGGDVPLWFSNWRVIGQSVPAGKKIKVGTEVCLDAMKDSDM
ncbi:PASTA domain-containing protein [Actinoplanes sp. NPDC024001]|uniref:PASTA domain-containing protein n=1 Tax=Actinoplanes sp. NPDC024001 TaxID=3154598 RepID=UPI0033EB0B19